MDQVTKQNWKTLILNCLRSIFSKYSKDTMYCILVINANHQPCVFARVTIGNTTGFTDNHGFVNFRLKPSQYDIVVNYSQKNESDLSCLDIISSVDFAQNQQIRIVLN